MNATQAAFPLKTKRRHLKELKTFEDVIAEGRALVDCAVQSIDFRERDFDWSAISLRNVVFLGCRFEDEDEDIVRRAGGVLYPPFEGIPYNPYRKSLYDWRELAAPSATDSAISTDLAIYRRFSETRHNPDINEALAQRVHDHAVDDALRDLLEFDDEGMTKKKCVGFMGGHGAPRSSVFYRKAAIAAKRLTERGFYAVSGGGPGVMEAANLGAYLAGKPDDVLFDAIDYMKTSDVWKDDGYIQRSIDVVEKHDGADSLAVPTWFYGHEPSNVFATSVAKYFSNSIREDTLLAVALYGVVYAPGSAGTTQEIFQDAAQNHYGTFGYYSPMAFLGVERYEIQTMIYPLLRQLSYGKPYHDLLFVSDDPEAIVEFIANNKPIKKGAS
jgi:predicted Rossmann-fold nucleotide-binding protein